jgi:hypothetical protein
MKITHDDLARMLGQIEAKLEALEPLPERVAKLERSQSWLNGGCTVLGGMFGWLLRLAYGRW